METQTWMNDCGTCRALLDALTAAEQDVMAYLAVREIVQSHIEGSHADVLPDFDPACPNCQEWAITTGAPLKPDGATTQPVLEREARLHRAGHLLPTPTHAAVARLR